MAYTVAILGRPNVGKSTLFNRLVGRREALVHDTPGVTRDRREGQGRIADLEFRVIDTAGLDEPGGPGLEARMRAQTDRALAEADLVLLLVDARAGVVPLDRHFADWLRGQAVPVLAVANKCEGRAGQGGFYDAYALGLGDPVAISALGGEGFADLYQAIAGYLRGGPDPESEAAAARPLRLAIVGRPNVGKSTLANRLIGEERLLTGPEPGVTREAVPVDWAYDGRPIRLVDTAGMRRRARIDADLERLSVADAERALSLAEVAVLVLDATRMLERQDLTIARKAADEGRALVVAANKWDLVSQQAAAKARLRDRLETSLPQLRGVPTVMLSALTGHGVGRLMPAVFAAHERWNRRLSTGALNRWLAEVAAHHPPPMAQGRAVKLRYLTQVKARPPTFVLFCNRPQALAVSYVRYLVNDLRHSFDLPGVPLRLHPRKGRNPYIGD